MIKLITIFFVPLFWLGTAQAQIQNHVERSLSENDQGCAKQIQALILESSLTDYADKKLVLFVEEIQPELIRIKLTNPPAKSEEHPLIYAWLDLDLNKLKLLNVTYDPENPIEIKIDTRHIPAIKAACQTGNSQ